jgi:phenylpyruvate tautomerase PptA (4-oxalocrotonate tautomerase family)
MDKFGEMKNSLLANRNPLGGQQVKNYAAQVGQPIKAAVKAKVQPVLDNARGMVDQAMANVPNVPGVASPFAANLVSGITDKVNQALNKVPSMTNVAVNPAATGQATAQEVAGMTLEQWRNVQRMLGMAPSA